MHAIQSVCLTIPNGKCSLVVSHINSSCSIGGESVLNIWIKCVIGDSCPSVHVRCTIGYHNYLVVTEERRGREDGREGGRERGRKKQKGEKRGGKEMRGGGER